MPSRKENKQLIAREKAINTRVYISGLRGDHTLETGLAYYYRGHYLYSFPGGTLIEPMPYSIKKGIMVHGMVSPSAPTYDGNSAGLVDEESVRALEASVKNELGSREAPRGADGGGEEVDEGGLGGYAELLLRTLSPSLVARGAAMPVPSPARVSALRRDADSALRASPSSSLLGLSSPLGVPESSLWGPSSSRSVPDFSSLIPLVPSSSIRSPISSLSVPVLSLSTPSFSPWTPASARSVSSSSRSVPSFSLPAPALSLPAPSSTPSSVLPAPSVPTPAFAFTFTPHAGAAFLAASAPGSRFTSPLPSPSSRETLGNSQRLSAIRGAP
jgi:hypothetical protein